MTLADGFSRLPNKKTKEEINLNVRVDFVQFSTEKLTQIHQATKADPILCELWETILQGWPNTFREISQNLQPYWSYRDELAIENGIIIIPKVMQPGKLQGWTKFPRKYGRPDNSTTYCSDTATQYTIKIR